MSNEVTHWRIFLKQIATTVGAVPLGLGATVVTGGIAATVAPSANAPDAAPIAHARHFFDGNEGRAAEAAVARIIPADDTGPGDGDLHVPQSRGRDGAADLLAARCSASAKSIPFARCPTSRKPWRFAPRAPQTA